MEDVLVLATSYAPNHNFWPGSPASWWLRGAIAFFLMTGPILIALVILILLICRKLRHWGWLSVVGVMFCIALVTNRLWLRDGDMPWFIGGVWGQRLAPWIAVSGLVLLVAMFRFRNRHVQRGFEVITRG